MDDDRTIKMLNEAFMHEIVNAMTYVRNAFVIRECDPSRVTESIAVDEMRHMWWLADLIVKRGGKPSMEHEELEFGGDSPKAMLERQVALETEAVEMYKRMIAATEDQEIAGVMRHILDEEKRHRKEFKERLEKM